MVHDGAKEIDASKETNEPTEDDELFREENAIFTYYDDEVSVNKYNLWQDLLAEVEVMEEKQKQMEAGRQNEKEEARDDEDDDSSSTNDDEEIEGGTTKGKAKVKNMKCSKKGKAAKRDVGYFKFNEEAARKAIALMIILDRLPFSVVEKEGFRYLCSKIMPPFNIPSRRTVTRDCLEICRKAKRN